MSRALPSAGIGIACIFALLLAGSPVLAQPSAAGHVSTPYGYNPGYYASPSTIQIYPGERGYRTSMQVQRYYQYTERTAPVTAHPPASAVTSSRTTSTATAAPELVVSIREPAVQPVLVDIRGPDGTVRSFPVAGGRENLSRVIVVRPGESVTIEMGTARVEATKKKLPIH
jgi:hypothetical protein